MIETVLIPSSFLEVKNFLRRNENDFFEIIQALGDKIGFGRGVLLECRDKPVSSKFTGRGLCLFGSLLLREMLEQQFPQNETYPVMGRVSTRDSMTDAPEIEHFWVRTTIGEEKFFLDGTYGQIHPWLNRIVFDHSVNEAAYYGANHRSYKTKVHYTSEQIAERLKENRNLILVA